MCSGLHGKATGLGNLPSKSSQVNCGWVLAAKIAADLVAWAVSPIEQGAKAIIGHYPVVSLASRCSDKQNGS
jgi:hypothetical protein